MSSRTPSFSPPTRNSRGPWATQRRGPRAQPEGSAACLSPQASSSRPGSGRAPRLGHISFNQWTDEGAGSQGVGGKSLKDTPTSVHAESISELLGGDHVQGRRPAWTLVSREAGPVSLCPVLPSHTPQPYPDGPTAAPSRAHQCIARSSLETERLCWIAPPPSVDQSLRHVRTCSLAFTLLTLSSEKHPVSDVLEGEKR